MTGFHIYDDYDDQLALVGTDTGAALMSAPSRVEFYLDWFRPLEQRAAYGDQARELLRRISDRYRTMDESP